jgi:hypothetical protein
VNATYPVDLLHPSGRIERTLLLGEQCPPIAAGTARATRDVDLALIAPSISDLGKRHWLEHAAREAARSLGEQGLVYARVPRKRRWTARRELQAAGLVIESSLVHLPGADSPRYLVPLRTDPWRHALSRVVAARPLGRRILLRAQALPLGDRVLFNAMPTVGIVARRPGADPLLAWVARLGGETRETTDAVLATSWRGPEASVVLHCFAPGKAEPWGVAKVADGSSTEAELLDAVGVTARTAGVRVPRRLANGRLNRRSAVVESVVPGSPAAEVLRRSPVRFVELATGIATWLERWNVSTAQAKGASAVRLREELLDRAGELEPLIPGGRAYRSWLAERFTALEGRDLPLVAVHNDLTMWNIVLDEHGSIGVLDWAEAEEHGLPLTDFFYSMADAAAACEDYEDRLDAVRSCFLPDGARAAVVLPMQQRVAAALGLAPPAAELSFHACWLRHAHNEQRAGRVGDDSFLSIVRWLARHAASVG